MGPSILTTVMFVTAETSSGSFPYEKAYDHPVERASTDDLGSPFFIARRFPMGLSLVAGTRHFRAVARQDQRGYEFLDLATFLP
jgi:hypothetical protein